MTTYNLNFIESMMLFMTLVNEDEDLLADDLERRIDMNMRSWEPYGGIPSRDTPVVMLDSRWDGDQDLITHAKRHNYGQEDT